MRFVGLDQHSRPAALGKQPAVAEPAAVPGSKLDEEAVDNPEQFEHSLEDAVLARFRIDTAGEALKMGRRLAHRPSGAGPRDIAQWRRPRKRGPVRSVSAEPGR